MSEKRKLLKMVWDCMERFYLDDGNCDYQGSHESLHETLQAVRDYLAAVPDRPVPAGCWQCGGRMVKVRPKYPGGEDRTVCPTCLADRIDMIVDIAKPNPPMKKE